MRRDELDEWDWDAERGTGAVRAVPIERAERDRWARQAVEEVRAGARTYDISSGDSVIVATRMDDGSIHLYDCIVRRETTLYDERPS